MLSLLSVVLVVMVPTAGTVAGFSSPPRRLAAGRRFTYWSATKIWMETRIPSGFDRIREKNANRAGLLHFLFGEPSNRFAAISVTATNERTRTITGR